MPAMASIAELNASSFAFEGLLNPLIFLTNCSDAARTSSGVTGGSKLNSILIFRHIVRNLPHKTNDFEHHNHFAGALPGNIRDVTSSLWQLRYVALYVHAVA